MRSNAHVNPGESRGRLARLFIAAVLVLGSICLPAPANATQYTATIVGTVAFGSDGGAFGGTGNLTGVPYRLVFTADDTKGQQSFTPNSGSGPTSQIISTGVQSQPVSAQLTINGHTVSFDGTGIPLASSRVFRNIGRFSVTILYSVDVDALNRMDFELQNVSTPFSTTDYDWRSSVNYTAQSHDGCDCTFRYGKTDASGSVGAQGTLNITSITIETVPPPPPPPVMDQVSTTGAGSPIGLLVSGQAASGPWQFHTIAPASGPIVSLGANLDASSAPETDRVVGFSEGHPPTIASATWTPGNDVVPLAFPRAVPVRLKIWVLQWGRLTPDHIVRQLQRVQTIWRLERVGATLELSPYTDTSSNPDAASFANFALDCRLRGVLEQTIGAEPGAINVYYVNQIVDDTGASVGTGVACDFADGQGTSTVVMSSLFAVGMGGLDTLPHELGHTFTLAHVGEGSLALVPNFDRSNLMWSGFDARPVPRPRLYLTEGQTYRAALNQTSAMNLVASGPGGNGSTVCYLLDSRNDTRLCPPIDKRIWADGALPPN